MPTGANPRSNPEWSCNSNSTRLPASFPHSFCGAASTAGARQRCWLPLCRRIRQPVRTPTSTRLRSREVSITASNGYGNQLAVSLPTRWFTVVASGYQGADLRFFFGGETLSNYNQAGGLIATADGFSVDRSSTVVFGTNAAGQAVVAPQRPVRGYGGFVQVGLPLSRWFNADPKGRNAGWQAYVEYGIDAANANDFRLAKGINATTGGGPIKDTSKGVTVFYKMNPWVQFGFEEGKYQGFALPNTKGHLHYEGRRCCRPARQPIGGRSSGRYLPSNKSLR